MKHVSQEIKDKWAGEICQLYTMHGIERAMVCGRLLDFAKIASLDSALTIEVNWFLVDRKMTQDKLFYSC